MRLSYTTLLAIALSNSLVNSAPTAQDTTKEVRAVQDDELNEMLLNLQSYKSKRDEIYSTLDKREYEIVTDVLKALNNTQLAPKIIHYLATNSTLEPIVIKTIVAVLKSGKLNMTALFNALDESGLVTTVVQDLIADCSLYVSLFRTAENAISGLVDKVQSAINNSKRDVIPERAAVSTRSVDIEARLDLDEVVVNLLQSLANSGLATSVVESIITDSSYLPFASELIKEVLESNALDIGDLVDALKNTTLASDLLKSILNAQTFDTVITNAFAAASGDCSSGASSSSSGSSGSSGSSASSSSTTTDTVDPCKKKRRRRRRRSSYNY